VRQPWSCYYEAAGDAPRETLLFALDRFDDEREPGFAVDLGCGTGRDTVEILRRGWRVLAIDAQDEAVPRLLARGDLGDGRERLETLVGSFLDVTWPDADLVTSSFSLPFCPPDAFDSLWARVVSSLRPGGRFCGQLFGVRDAWATRDPAGHGQAPTASMTFHTRGRVDELLAGFDVELLDEVEEDGRTAVGDPKHWHLFHVVARKR
jgi:SAM-dependent methyltransferase